MCASTEKGVRERNLWAPGKSQLSARRTPFAHSRDVRCPCHLYSTHSHHLLTLRQTIFRRLPCSSCPPVNDQFKQFFSAAMATGEDGHGRFNNIICNVFAERARSTSPQSYNMYSFFLLHEVLFFSFTIICPQIPFLEKQKCHLFFFFYQYTCII